MTILITSPLLKYEEITNWSRNLLNQVITIDKNTRHAITKIVSFQAFTEEMSYVDGNDQAEYQVIVLVELSGPIREVASDG